MPSTVLVLVADYFEESEVLFPVHRLAEEGHTVMLASPGGAPVTGKGGLGPLAVDANANEVSAEDLDALVVPGGFAPDLLRRHEPVLELVRRVDGAGKPVGFICHGGWVGISAGVLRGRTCTSVAAIRVDLENAGADWRDEPVVTDRNLVTARVPADLGPWMRAFVQQLS